MQVPSIVSRAARSVTPLAAVAAPSFGWEATVGVLVILGAITACLLTGLRWFASRTLSQRRDVIELVRAWRGTPRRTLPEEVPPGGPASDR